MSSVPGEVATIETVFQVIDYHKEHGRCIPNNIHTSQGQDERARTLPCASCAALTWRGFEAATRTGSRERGGGLRQTLGRQQDRWRACALSGEGTLREPFGRLRWRKDEWRYATGGSLFRYQKARWFPFSLSHGPQI